ncbi:dihydroneopterin aldolase [Campylobacter sp. CCUG 57310]|uniref:dihydroneopterin aldolase n=1 Tax=Campylobacter sp. CCUG 57310 TaxID=2517362 RepID=UPI0020B1374B|nr:dihydroneopterin aldolase [Campylobacter sp. CCUG 57310]QKF92855.1 dihydroneopterin aldolase [Campylobacter sp. CCUG 57310]
MITTLIKDYEFETIIGMLEFERTNPQKVRINAEFASENFIDYVEVIEFVEAVYEEFKFQTVENSLEICSQKLKEKFSGLKFLKMEILKTEIFKNALVGAKIELEY